MSNFAYSVAIKLSLANLASKGVRLLAKDFMAAHGAAAKLEDKLKALKLIGVGYGMEKAGQGILGFMGKAVDSSKEYVHQMSLMNIAGWTQKEIAGSVAAAWKTTGSVITTTAAQNLETLQELRTAFGKGEGMQHAYAVLPQVQRVSSILASLTGREQSHVGFDMVKAIELGSKGALSVDSMMRQSEMMSKALVQFGRTLTVSDFHQSLKMSRAMAPYMSDEFKYQYLPTLIQEMKTGAGGGGGSYGGASGAGMAIASLGQVVVGQMIPKALIQNWIDSGLVSRGRVVADPHNRTTSKILPGGVVGQNEFGANPYLWAQKYAMPAVNRLMAEKHLDQYGAILALTHNRVAAFALQTLINKAAQFERDRKLITEGPTSYDSYQTMLKTDPEAAQIAMQKQWHNTLDLIGWKILPRLVPYMVKFADWLDRISQWMQRNPEAANRVVLGLAALGVGLNVIGKVMMAAGMIKFLGMGGTIMGMLPWLGKANLALLVIGGTAAFAYKNLDKLNNIMNAFSDKIAGINKHINDLIRNNPTVAGATIKQGGLLAAPFLIGPGLPQRIIDGLNDWATGHHGGGVSAVPPPKKQKISFNVTADRRGFSAWVAEGMNQGMSAPRNGGTSPDGSISRLPVNMAWS
ncbi:MAG: hypothetical protein P4M15_06140 [Alphaproteobacteria bacterium]|nr:hypothetical protein [Alphaproteobacteria bacterium]